MFIPIGDDNSGRRIFPLVTWAIAGINAFVWYLQLSYGASFTAGFSAIPYELTHGVDLVSRQILSFDGQSISIPQAPGPQPIYLTVLSSMFMHGSWMHIIGNMTYLLIFADQIEDILGHVHFIFFYLFCGIAASAAHTMVDPNSVIPSLGASGAIAGVLGAYLIKYPSNRVKVLMRGGVGYLPASIVLGGWIVLQLFSQITVMSGAHSGVAYMAHIGGFVAGVIMISMVRRR